MRRMLEEHPMHAPEAIIRGGISSRRVYSGTRSSGPVEHLSLGDGSAGIGIHVVIYPGPLRCPVNVS